MGDLEDFLRKRMGEPKPVPPPPPPPPVIKKWYSDIHATSFIPFPIFLLLFIVGLLPLKLPLDPLIFAAFALGFGVALVFRDLLDAKLRRE